MTTMGDRKTRAALNDLLEVTRRVMLPVSQDGTFWCDEVEATKMVEWTLSVRLHTVHPSTRTVLLFDSHFRPP